MPKQAKGFSRAVPPGKVEAIGAVLAAQLRCERFILVPREENACLQFVCLLLEVLHAAERCR